jgi:O-antigen ligase
MRPAEPAVAAMPRLRMMDTVIVVAVVALLLGLTLAHPSATRIHTWPWALFAAVYWLLLVTLAIASSTWTTYPRWPNPLVPAGLLLLAAATAFSALMSPFAAASLPRIWPTLGGTALFFLLHWWLSFPRGPQSRTVALARGVSLICAVVLVVSLVQWSRGNWPLLWGPRNTIPFGHSIYTAGFVVLALPWCVWSAWQNRAGARALWIAMIGVGLVVLASTSSRGGVLAFASAAAAAAGLILLRAPWSTPRKFGIALACVAMAAAAVLTNPRLRALVLERSWSDAAQESNVQRSAMIAAGLKLGQERPWLGWGPGTVPLAYPRVRAQLDGGVDNVLQLHNTPIQLWATTGLAGIVALALLAAGTVHAAAFRLRTKVAAPESLAAAASLGGYGLFALTDHQFDVPFINALAAANLAILTATPARRRHARRRPPRRSTLLVGLATAVVFFALPLLRDLRARHGYESAVVAWEEGRASDWLRALDRAAALAPTDVFYQHHAAGALMRARETERDATKQAGHTLAAVQRLEASLRTGVHQEFAHFNLGWLNLELERAIPAAHHFIAAAHLVPDKGGVYFGLGLALQAAGDSEQAIRAFALEWVSDPLSMSSPAWEVPLLAPLRSAVRAEALRVYAHLGSEHAAAATAAAWARWWLGEPVERTALTRGFSAEARAFAAALPVIEAGAGITSEVARRAPVWAGIYAAWREPDSPSGFATAAGGDAAFAAALQRRAQRHRSSFHAFLTAPTEDDPALLQTFRRQRTGYGVLAMHPDGPVLVDAYTVQQNRVAAQFASGLLPRKGWLPGRFLLALLPEPEALENK